MMSKYSLVAMCTPDHYSEKNAWERCRLFITEVVCYGLLGAGAIPFVARCAMTLSSDGRSHVLVESCSPQRKAPQMKSLNAASDIA
jgi:hypothetical protein